MADPFDGWLDDEIPENATWCDSCQGSGEVECYCAGDFCCCGRQEVMCRSCQGNGWFIMTPERLAAENRLADFMREMWGKHRPKPAQDDNP